MPKAFTSHELWHSSILETVNLKDTASESSTKPTRLLYSYDNAFQGFSAVISEDELQVLEKLPGFVTAYTDKMVTLDTTHTFEFLGLNPESGLWPASHYGEDVIVGVIDTGVWPESRSYKDDGMTEIPSRWKGICEPGQEFNASMCNNKLIGARNFLPSYETGKIEPPFDLVGHGTHTASTAAGNFVEQANVFGQANGTAAGVAPWAHLAIYQVCSDFGCSESSILAAMDTAVEDGVDVLSLSLGGGSSPFYADGIAVGAFGAIQNGVFVSCSAGNSGPFNASL